MISSPRKKLEAFFASELKRRAQLPEPFRFFPGRRSADCRPPYCVSVVREKEPVSQGDSVFYFQLAIVVTTDAAREREEDHDVNLSAVQRALEEMQSACPLLWPENQLKVYGFTFLTEASATQDDTFGDILNLRVGAGWRRGGVTPKS
jgi:hypothetical protein